MIGEEILLAIDDTLDGLIRNAEAIQHTNLETLSELEVDAFQKTQESLIQRLLHLDQHLEQKRKGLKKPDRRFATEQIALKWGRFEKMESSYQPRISKRIQRKELLSKRKGKRFLYQS